MTITQRTDVKVSSSLSDPEDELLCARVSGCADAITVTSAELSVEDGSCSSVAALDTFAASITKVLLKSSTGMSGMVVGLKAGASETGLIVAMMIQ